MAGTDQQGERAHDQHEQGEVDEDREHGEDGHPQGHDGEDELVELEPAHLGEDDQRARDHGQHGQDADRAEAQGVQQPGEEPVAAAGGPLEPGLPGGAEVHERGAALQAAGGDGAGDVGAGVDLRAGLDHRARAQERAGADPGVLAHGHAAEVEDIALEPVAGEVHLVLDRRAVADAGHAADGGHRVEVGVAAHPVAEQPEEQHHHGGAHEGLELVEDQHPLGHPDPQVGPGAAGVRAGAQPEGQQPDEQRGEHQPAGQGEEHEPAENQGQQRRVRDPARAQHVEEQPHDDRGAQDVAQPRDGVEGREEGDLHEAVPAGDVRHPALARGVLGDDVDGRQRGQVLVHPGERGVPVDLGDRGVRVGAADLGDELGHRHGRAAEDEEVAVLVDGQGAELVRPQGGEPLELGVDLRGLRGGAGRGQRPGQGLAVHLAGGLQGQLVHQGQRGHHLARQPVGEQAAGVGEVHRARGLGHEVAHEDLVAGRGGVHGGGAGLHAGQPRHLLVDLAHLHAPAGDLDLVVGAAHEDDALGVGAHEVPGAVGPLPAQGVHGRELLGVLGGVQVAAQAHAADDQLALLAPPDGVAGGVDDRQLPPGQRQADAHRRLAGEHGAGRDDRGLGGAVGVPDLAAGVHQAGGELVGARLPAEDEQADAAQRLGRPHRRERRHRGDGGDVPLDQPRAEVGARAHHGAGGGDQGGAGAPGQPHLLARGVEGHGEPRHHAVARAQGAPGQVELGLGVHEGGGREVADRHALGLAGGAGGEDDPGVVARAGLLAVGARADAGAGPEGQVRAVDGAHRGLLPDRVRPLVRVVEVDRDVGGAGEDRAEDGHVEVHGPGGDADAHAVPAADVEVPQALGLGLDALEELGVAEHGGPVVEGHRVRVARDGVHDDVHERARGRRGRDGEDGAARDLRHGLRVQGAVEDLAVLHRVLLRVAVLEQVPTASLAGRAAARGWAHCH